MRILHTAEFGSVDREVWGVLGAGDYRALIEQFVRMFWIPTGCPHTLVLTGGTRLSGVMVVTMAPTSTFNSQWPRASLNDRNQMQLVKFATTKRSEMVTALQLGQER